MIRYIEPTKEQWGEITERPTQRNRDVEQSVSSIIEDVKRTGDAALFKLNRLIDGVYLDQLQVSEQEITEAAAQIATSLKEAIAAARSNIASFHAAQKPVDVDIETQPGVRCLQRSLPIERVGLYIPGGSAPLFSTVLMLAVPASIAGCREIVICTPPMADGRVAPVILYTAALCGVDKIYKVGGAQAIAAMAYGTESIARVDKIFGPGNQYVTVAKQMLSSVATSIDMPAGPSEVMVMADSSANPRFVAADLLSQAEHGADSQVILLASSEDVARVVEEQMESLLESLPRQKQLLGALQSSRTVVMADRSDAIDFANAYGAEHLIVSMENPWQIADSIRFAGSIFVGNYTPESAGDYASGTNHTLPTGGWIRSCGGVNLDSFLRKITIQQITPAGLQEIGSTVEIMAAAEGLEAHRIAVTERLKTLNR